MTVVHVAERAHFITLLKPSIGHSNLVLNPMSCSRKAVVFPNCRKTLFFSSIQLFASQGVTL